MNNYQAIQAMNFNVDVCITSKTLLDLGYSKGNYKISEIHRVRAKNSNIDNKAYYSATISKNSKHYLQVKVSDIDISKKYNDFIEENVKRQFAKDEKAVISKMYSKYKTKKAVYEHISSVIDGIKKERNC